VNGLRGRPHGAASAWLLLAGAAALMVVLAARSRLPRLHYYHPAGYVEKVWALIDGGVLRATPGGGVVFDAGGEAELEAFREESYLAADMARLGRPGSALYLADGELRVDPRTHRIDLPFAPRRRWTGRLLYREGRAAAVLEGEGVLLQVEPGPTGAPLSPGAYRDLPVSGLRGSWAAPGFRLTDREPGRHFARLERVGDDAVLTVAFEEPRVAVNGHRVPAGHRVRLDDGDALLVRRPGLERLLFFRGGEDAAVLSRMRRVNGRPEREAGPAAAQVPIAADLAAGIERVVAFQETREEERPFDVVLTLDRHLQEVTQAALERFVAGRRSRLAPAAVTLLDARTGELLALASWPTAEALAGATGLSEPQRRRLGLDQNLPLHPVGSAIKPVLAAAIWEAFPELGGLEVGPHAGGRYREVLGVELAEPYLPVFSHPAIDRRGFLQRSCNLYLAELGLLALAAPGGEPLAGGALAPGAPWTTLGGRPVGGRPAIAAYVEGDQVLHLESHPMAAVLERAFGIETAAVGHTDAAANTAARYDPGPIAPLLAWLGVSGAEAQPLFAATPERVNLRLNQVQRLRSDFVSLLLGGSFGAFSNVQLAEAAARLGTGRAVEARLIRSVGGEGAAPAEIPPVALSAGTLAWVREGMAAVTAPGGTAAELGPAVEALRRRLAEAGLELSYLSKTGTAQMRDRPASGATPPWSAVYLFYAGARAGAGVEEPPRRAIAGAIWVEDRGAAAVAVALAEEILEELGDHLES
jgi:hypothetical protein